MTTLQLILIAIVQGITEFLPISSSAHLRMIPTLTGWPDKGLAIDVAVHVGTLGAVLIFFRRDVVAMFLGLAELMRGRAGAQTQLVVNVIIGTVPVVVAGALLLRFGYESGALAGLRSIEVIGWSMAGFGLVLLAADRLGMTIRRLEHLRVGGAVAIGLAQVLALVPGTSRAGITMTAARMLGYERTEAARFSLLLSIPTILASAVPSTVEIVRAGDAALGLEALLAALFALVAALLAIAAMMRWLRRARFTPFVVYRVVVGVAILTWVYA